MSKKLVFGIAGALTLCMLMAVGIITASILTRTQMAAAAPQIQAAPANSGAAGSQAQPNNPNVQAALSTDSAAQIAMSLVPGATLTRTPELVNYNGTVAYEVLMNQGAVYVDANSGQILGTTVQASGRQRAGRDGGGEQFEHQSGGENEGFGGFFGGDGD